MEQKYTTIVHNGTRYDGVGTLILNWDFPGPKNCRNNRAPYLLMVRNKLDQSWSEPGGSLTSNDQSIPEAAARKLFDELHGSVYVNFKNHPYFPLYNIVSNIHYSDSKTDNADMVGQTIDKTFGFGPIRRKRPIGHYGIIPIHIGGNHTYVNTFAQKSFRHKEFRHKEFRQKAFRQKEFSPLHHFGPHSVLDVFHDNHQKVRAFLKKHNQDKPIHEKRHVPTDNATWVPLEMLINVLRGKNSLPIPSCNGTVIDKIHPRTVSLFQDPELIRIILNDVRRHNSLLVGNMTVKHLTKPQSIYNNVFPIGITTLHFTLQHKYKRVSKAGEDATNDFLSSKKNRDDGQYYLDEKSKAKPQNDSESDQSDHQPSRNKQDSDSDSDADSATETNSDNDNTLNSDEEAILASTFEEMMRKI